MTATINDDDVDLHLYSRNDFIISKKAHYKTVHACRNNSGRTQIKILIMIILWFCDRVTFRIFFFVCLLDFLKWLYMNYF